MRPLALKDTVNVPMKTTVRLLVTFDERPGEWMFHCHILDHADGGLMGTVLVGDGPARQGIHRSGMISQCDLPQPPSEPVSQPHESDVRGVRPVLVPKQQRIRCRRAPSCTGGNAMPEMVSGPNAKSSTL